MPRHLVLVDLSEVIPEKAIDGVKQSREGNVTDETHLETSEEGRQSLLDVDLPARVEDS